MQHLAFISVHPAFIEAYARFGVFRAAAQRGIKIHSINLRDYAVDHHGTVDEAPFGGGDGMVLRPEPLAEALAALPFRGRVILPSPSGRSWKQSDAQSYATRGENLIFIAGRFAGVDQRLIDLCVDEEVSIGDFVVSGGELPSLLLADSILRQVDGVLGNSLSAHCDSFAPGMSGLLEYPLYTRPLEFKGQKVPAVLLTGDHKKIAAWRENEALARTRARRPDLLSDAQKK